MEYAVKDRPGFASLYKIPSSITHWTRQPAWLDSTVFVLSLLRAYPKPRILGPLDAAGLRLVQERYPQRYMDRMPKEVRERMDKAGTLRETVLRPEKERKQSGIGDMPHFQSNSKSERGKTGPRLNDSDSVFFVESQDGQPVSADQILRLETEFQSEIRWLGAVFEAAQNHRPDKPKPNAARPKLPYAAHFCPFPRTLLVEPEAGASLDDLVAVLRKEYHLVLEDSTGQRELSLEHPELSLELPARYYFRLEGDRRNHVYLLKEALPELLPGQVKAAFFENMPMLSPQQARWNRARIQADGLGHAGGGVNLVAVAVIDRGVQSNNGTGAIPCVPGRNILPDGGPSNDDTSPVAGDEHGTCCAGIISHQPNPGIEQFGMVPNAKVHPIMPMVVKNFSDVQIKGALVWAFGKGARVFNLSATSDAWDRGTLNPILETVRKNGGVICASTGNDDGSVGYPANSPNVIAVGATDHETDDRVRDQPYGWGSNYGSEVSVMAPGINIPTTDLNGADGISPGDYTTEFWGTSAAAPHVAAVVAMMISKCRDLGFTPNFDNIKHRLEFTADKVGTCRYDPDPPARSSRNIEMGAGRVNALRALSFNSESEFKNP